MFHNNRHQKIHPSEVSGFQGSASPPPCPLLFPPLSGTSVDLHVESTDPEGSIRDNQTLSSQLHPGLATTFQISLKFHRASKHSQSLVSATIVPLHARLKDMVGSGFSLGF